MVTNWIQKPNRTIKKIKIELSDFPTSPLSLVGFDPGTVNLGIAEILPSTRRVYIYQIEMKRADDPVQRIQEVKWVIMDCLQYPYRAGRAIIEGASYGRRFRQVELAEQRAAIVLWTLKNGFDPKIVAPNTIRSKVFSNHKIKADEYWEELAEYPDAATALSCAIYGVMK